ncbi:YwqG family protein [Gemella cuniculi]|uniref:YwqG family protein n=1 Tax=Gemella cuniculi TaxID=150240 RepID=UPI0004064D8D|nr:YwqG family protein [Gemella cuniculi]
MITSEMIKKVIEKISDNTKVEYINIITKKTDEELSIFDSKFGGIPYLPKNKELPVNEEGVQLALLAQINCEELPENDIYPKTGLMQFWIGRDDIMGLDDKLGSRVFYYSNVDKNVTLESVLERYHLLDDNNDEEYSPFYKKNLSLALEFEKDFMSITSEDHRFEKKAIATINELYPDEKIEDLWSDLEDDISDELFDAFSGGNHCIGGYPNFTQWDPRESCEKDYSVLLLQIESEWGKIEDAEIMWGDAGVGNFFISKESLKNLNFDDVLYNWDCS